MFQNIIAASNNLSLAAADVVYLAADNPFVDPEGIWRLVQNIFTFIGTVIIVAVIWKIIKSAMGASAPGTVRNMVIGVFFAILCFNLSLAWGAVDGMSNLVENIIDTVTGVVSD